MFSNYECELKTKRFVLRTLKPENVSDEYISWLQSDGAKKYISYSSARDQSQKALEKYVQEKLDSHEALMMGVYSDRVHIGNIKYEPIDIFKKTAVMGILIGDEAWRGQGVGGEIIEAMNSWLKRVHGISTIVLGVDSGNKPAVHLYSKLGFEITSDTINGFMMKLSL